MELLFKAECSIYTAANGDRAKLEPVETKINKLSYARLLSGSIYSHCIHILAR
jgi:hypothetical protein